MAFPIAQISYDHNGNPTIKIHMQDDLLTKYTIILEDGELIIQKDTAGPEGGIIITTGPGINNLKLK